MKTFKQLVEEMPKEFNILKQKGEKIKKIGKEFVDSGQADELKNAALKFMFNKFDGVVEKGNKKYNEIKSKVNK